MPDRPLSTTERFLRIFSDVRPGEGFAGLTLLLNIFLVLAAYYLIKPVREGWLSISDIRGLSKIELKAYSSFGQSLVLLLVVPLYARLATRLSRQTLITTVTLFFVSNLVIFWLLQPGLLTDRSPHAGIAFYLWVGIFSATVVAQFWAFAADLYTDERGKRLLPLIAVGASSGAAIGSWFTGRFIKFDKGETFDLILIAIVPLLAALVLSWMADRQGPVRKRREDGYPTVQKRPAAPDPTGAYRLIFKTKYLFAVAILSLMINWVNTNGENILFGTVQEALETEYNETGVTDPAVISRFVKVGTTAFYSDLYMWVNLSALLIQALLVSRMLKYGGFATILFLTPLVSLFSYSLMALFPLLAVIRIMKVAENSANYSVNNTARHVLW
ncbi:MAG: NTP/NDP exchange transporter, partial [Thermodesulfobacteriota bacterium]